MPRPKKTCSSRRTHIIAFRLNDAEFQKLAITAESANLRTNDLARMIITADTNRITVKPHAVTDPALLKRLDRIGNNLNQLVKNAHIFGRVSPQITELCEQIKAIIEAATKD